VRLPGQALGGSVPRNVHWAGVDEGRCLAFGIATAKGPAVPRKHWEWRITEEAEAAFASMRQVVEYNWADEVEDFDAQDEDGQRGHIYQHLERVDGFLSSYEC